MRKIKIKNSIILGLSIFALIIYALACIIMKYDKTTEASFYIGMLGVVAITSTVATILSFDHLEKIEKMEKPDGFSLWMARIYSNGFVLAMTLAIIIVTLIDHCSVNPDFETLIIGLIAALISTGIAIAMAFIKLNA